MRNFTVTYGLNGADGAQTVSAETITDVAHSTHYDFETISPVEILVKANGRYVAKITPETLIGSETDWLDGFNAGQSYSDFVVDFTVMADTMSEAFVDGFRTAYSV